MRSFPKRTHSVVKAATIKRLEPKPLLALFAAFLALMMVVALASGCAPPEEAEAPEAEEVPDVDLEDDPAEDASADEASADIGEVRIVELADLQSALEETRGRVAVVNFWATWCAPCVKEMPEFVAFYEQYDVDDVAFISVSVDHPDTVDDSVGPFVVDHNIPFDVMVIAAQPEELSEAIGYQFTGAVPVTLVYDQEGEIQESWLQELKLADLQEAVDPLLS